MFFNLQEFNSHLAPSGWMCRLSEASKGASQHTPEIVRLQQSDPSGQSVAPIPVKNYEFLMVQDHRLYIWQKFENGILIRQYTLSDESGSGKPLEEFIPIASKSPGRNAHPSRLTYHHFVTYIRKSDLVQPDDRHEKYVVLYLHQDQLHVIPMQEFNATGGDPMYVWPVLASYDASSDTLYGAGMRMGTFSMKLGIGG